MIIDSSLGVRALALLEHINLLFLTESAYFAQVLFLIVIYALSMDLNVHHVKVDFGYFQIMIAKIAHSHIVSAVVKLLKYAFHVIQLLNII